MAPLLRSRIFISSIVARLPLTMLSIALLVHAQHLTGSLGQAGIVTGAYAAALGAGGPLLGAIVDRRGQTLVLAGGAAVTAGLLLVLAVLPEGTSAGALVVIAAGVGLAAPPVGACMRALLPGLVADSAAREGRAAGSGNGVARDGRAAGSENGVARDGCGRGSEAGSLRAAYALESSAVELTWVSGPPLALAVGALWSTGAALAVAAGLLLAATAAFAATPASRHWQPTAGERLRGGSLRVPAMRTLVVVFVAVGIVFGAAEVGITAAAEGFGSTAAAAPLLALWGAGSLIGGLLATRLGGGAQTAAGLAVLLVGLTLGHAVLAAAPGALVLGALLLVAGAGIAPTLATVYAMVDRAAPAGTATEAFAWMATASAVGAAVGAALAGALADGGGAAAAFALSGVAGTVAVALCLARAASLPGRAAPAIA